MDTLTLAPPALPGPTSPAPAVSAATPPAPARSMTAPVRPVGPAATLAAVAPVAPAPRVLPGEPGARSAAAAPATLRRLELVWLDDAACDGADPALFDPVNRHVAARATAVCADCPVQRACLLDALVDEQDTAYGPWLVRGGMAPKERRDLRGPARARLVDDLRGSLAPNPVR